MYHGARYSTRMTGQRIKDAFGWGFLLWFIGYILGIVLFMIVPPALIGWILMPVGTALTIWVLWKKVKATDMRDYVTLAVVWTGIAVIGDYFFLVKLFKPADGYYKPDVYLYYLLTFLLPLLAGRLKSGSAASHR